MPTNNPPKQSAQPAVKKKALREYHQRRFVLTGAFAIIKSNGLLNNTMYRILKELESQTKMTNWNQYQKDKLNLE
jgi:hypothetical protein